MRQVGFNLAEKLRGWPANNPIHIRRLKRLAEADERGAARFAAVTSLLQRFRSPATGAPANRQMVRDGDLPGKPPRRWRRKSNWSRGNDGKNGAWNPPLLDARDVLKNSAKAFSEKQKPTN